MAISKVLNNLALTIRIATQYICALAYPHSKLSIGSPVPVKHIHRVSPESFTGTGSHQSSLPVPGTTSALYRYRVPPEPFPGTGSHHSTLPVRVPPHPFTGTGSDQSPLRIPRVSLRALYRYQVSPGPFPFTIYTGSSPRRAVTISVLSTWPLPAHLKQYTALSIPHRASLLVLTCS